MTGTPFGFPLESPFTLAGATSQVDSLVEFTRPQSLLVGNTAKSSLFVPETKSIGSPPAAQNQALREAAGSIAGALAMQQPIAAPFWQGSSLHVSVGESSEVDHQMLLGFSVLNNSRQAIELLPQDYVNDSDRTGVYTRCHSHTKDGNMAKPMVTMEQILAAFEADDCLGFCLECGAEASPVEPDARRYTCESCGRPRVYGAEELLLMMALESWQQLPPSSSVRYVAFLVLRKNVTLLLTLCDFSQQLRSVDYRVPHI